MSVPLSDSCTITAITQHAPPSSNLRACSGAVGVGCQRLHLTTRPDNLAQRQALAAVGQVHLMRYYDDLFSAVDMVSMHAVVVVGVLQVYCDGGQGRLGC